MNNNKRDWYAFKKPTPIYARIEEMHIYATNIGINKNKDNFKVISLVTLVYQQQQKEEEKIDRN